MHDNSLGRERGCGTPPVKGGGWEGTPSATARNAVCDALPSRCESSIAACGLLQHERQAAKGPRGRPLIGAHDLAPSTSQIRRVAVGMK